LTIWGLSGAGFVLRLGEDILYIDPWLVPPDPSRTTHRAYPPPFPPEEVRKALALISTHEHEDHCNAQTIVGICNSSKALFLGPTSSTKKALAAGCRPSRVVALHPGDRYELSSSFRVVAFEANDPYEPYALMYLIETPRGNIFHSGDTAYFDGLSTLGNQYKVDVALLNFGRQIPTPEKPYYMSAERLVAAARDLRAGIVVPMHWNLWVETLEDPSPIEALLRSRSPDTKLVIIRGGEKLEL
jgi:L-ascorbate 6-phosphate lactonase